MGPKCQPQWKRKRWSIDSYIWQVKTQGNRKGLWRAVLPHQLKADYRDSLLFGFTEPATGKDYEEQYSPTPTNLKLITETHCSLGLQNRQQ